MPKAIDEFIEELLGMSGMPLHPEPKGYRDGSAREGMLWGALLLQARANCAQAEANLQQAKANEETSHNLLMSIQSTLGKESTIDLEPDRLESWYAAREDAANVVNIAEKVTIQAQEMITSDEQLAKPLDSGTDRGGKTPQGVAPPIGK